MQYSIPLKWPFTSKQAGTSDTSVTTLPSRTESRSYELYRSCNVLPMHLFLDCMIDQRYEALGQAPPEVLEETWITILSEYQQLRGDTIEGINQLRLLKLINRTKHHLYLFELCIGRLEKEYSEEVVKCLKKLGYSFNPANKDPLHYRTELQSCVLRSKTHYIQLEGWLKDLDEAVKQVKKPTREYYENVLLDLEEMQKVRYTFEEITVYKFVLMEKKFITLMNKRSKSGTRKS
jgi:hypothetical protein